MKDFENYIVYGLLVLVIAVLIFSFMSFLRDKSGMTASTVADEPGFRPISSGSTGMGDVSVELTPIGISNGQLRVKIAANTHSVDLSQFDLKKIITLEYNGKVLNPVSAPILSGHHSDGELVFDAGEEINSFTIKIKGIPKVEERVFRWK